MFIDRVKLKLIYLPSYTFPSADINVSRILPVPVGEAYLNILIYPFLHSYILCVWGGGGGGSAPGQISFKCRE